MQDINMQETEELFPEFQIHLKYYKNCQRGIVS